MLIELDLVDNNIGDGGVICLVDVFRSNKILIVFNLFYNNIGDKGVISLVSVFK